MGSDFQLYHLTFVWYGDNLSSLVSMAVIYHDFSHSLFWFTTDTFCDLKKSFGGPQFLCKKGRMHLPHMDKVATVSLGYKCE